MAGGLTVDESSRSHELDLAAGELLTMLLRREIDRLAHWMAVRSDEAEPWRGAGFSGTHLLYVTPEELDSVERDLEASIDRFSGRAAGDAPLPEGVRPVSVVAFGYPLPPTRSGR